MKEKVLLPQVLFSGIIKKNSSSFTHSSYYDFVLDTYREQVEKLSEIMKRFAQTSGPLIAWFLVDQRFHKQELVSLEKQLERFIEKRLGDAWDVEAMLILLDANSFDLEDLQDEVERLVHKLCMRYPFEYFAQLVNFGDPTVYQSLFVEAIRQFEERYASIYWDEDEVHVEYTVMEVQSETWVKQFRDFIIDHDYQAAFEMLQELDETEEVKALRCLLQMMMDRLNFAFEDALVHLEEAMKLLGNESVLVETKEKLSALLSKETKTRDLARIVELYRHIDMYLDMDDLVSFLVRFYRAREAVLFYLLQHAQTIPHEVTLQKKSTIYEVFDELEEKYDNWEIDGYYGAYFYLKSTNVAGALNVRNNSFIGHSRNKVDKEELWHSYFGTSRTTFNKAKRRFIMDTALMFRDLGVELDENIMSINRFLLQLSRKMMLKGQVFHEKRIH
ncbi:hypothetical protein P9857_07045 [Anoxybacillus geothermalis]|uniref:hypothetical protein n=1 Tax=Geobacillus stearothermophilus TaxID=1422 RepID=UPI002EA2C929|nr:hypothetical protein [Anoxybacillus geothermalis]